jgi:hypothetical protein
MLAPSPDGEADEKRHHFLSTIFSSLTAMTTEEAIAYVASEWNAHVAEKKRTRWVAADGAVSNTPRRQVPLRSVNEITRWDEEQQCHFLERKGQDSKPIVCIQNMCKLVLDQWAHRRGVVGRRVFEVELMSKYEGIARADIRIILDAFRNFESQSTTSKELRNPMAQHATVFNHELPSLIKQIENLPSSNTLLTQQVRHIIRSTHFGRIPKIHIPLGLPYAHESSSFEECDVVMVDHFKAVQLLRDKSYDLQKKVIIIRDSSEPAVQTSMELKDLVLQLSDLSEEIPGITVDVKDVKAEPRKRSSTRSLAVSEVISRLQDNNFRVTNEEPPLSFLNTVSKPSHFMEPACLSGKVSDTNSDPSDPHCGSYFSILDELLNILRQRSIHYVGNRSTSEPVDLEERRNFQIISQTMSSSLWRKEPIGAGTWVRCLLGVQLWPIIPTMSETDWLNYLEAGELWEPPRDNDIPLVTIYPGDILIMLPGNHNVYAPITLSTSVLDGGIFWDIRCVHQILEQVSQQAESMDDAEIPLQFTGILSVLKRRIAKYPHYFNDPEQIALLCQHIETRITLQAHENDRELLRKDVRHNMKYVLE